MYFRLHIVLIMPFLFGYLVQFLKASENIEHMEKTFHIERNNITLETEFVLIDKCTDSNGISHNCDLRKTFCDRGIFVCESCGWFCADEKLKDQEVKELCMREDCCQVYFFYKERPTINVVPSQEYEAGECNTPWANIMIPIIAVCLSLICVVGIGLLLKCVWIKKQKKQLKKLYMTQNNLTSCSNHSNTALSPSSSGETSGAHGPNPTRGIHADATNEEEIQKLTKSVPPVEERSDGHEENNSLYQVIAK